MGNWWREQFGRRPWWMNLLMIFCAYMAIVYLPWDLFVKPVVRDEEVWFGFRLYGWGAKATEPLHWAIYAAGAYGFWRMRSWMWPWAAVYAAQVAIAMLVWPIVYKGGASGWLTGVISGVLFGGLSVALWRTRPSFQPRRTSMRERYGEWALITGASAGIGTAFARRLAREGMSCVVAARREDRLQTLARELSRDYQVPTRVVAVDLSAPDGADKLIDAVKDIEIGVLVNNAGVGYAGAFEKQDTERLRQLVQLNCVSPVVVTSRLLPAIRARGRGAVIFTGSVAGHQPVPLNGVYSASKAFDLYLGESLWAELQGTGVDVLVLEPGPTETEFQQVAGETTHAGEPPEKVVDVALDALGRQPSVISGWFNWLQSNSVRFAPRSLTALIARRVMAKWTPAAMRA
jgi:uncharacterized protein